MKPPENEKEFVEMVIGRYEKLSILQEKMGLHALQLVGDYQKERRELLKYLAIISAGAVALAPQIISIVKNRHAFYSGIIILLFTAIISTAYIISSIEKGADDVTVAKNSKSAEADKLQTVRVAFIEATTHDSETYTAYMLEENRIIEELREASEQKQKDLLAKQKPFPRLDYSSEYIIFLFTIGAGAMIISITSLPLHFWTILPAILFVFIIINLFSAASHKVFVWLGYPMDYIKYRFTGSNNKGSS